MPISQDTNVSFYEFFAGGGLARKGMGNGWKCLFANDICPKKGKIYRRNFNGASELHIADIHHISTDMIPGRASLAWASFPCQDLSLAGPKPKSGLSAKRSGTFWPFWKLMNQIEDEGRGAPVIVLENVAGLLTSNKGKDFVALIKVITARNYNVGALVVDAEKFVPQSRPRLFIIAVKPFLPVPGHIIGKEPDTPWTPNNLRQAYCNLPNSIKKKWLWWRLPAPPEPRPELNSVIDAKPIGVKWHTAAETRRILSLMTDRNLEKVKNAQKTGRIEIGTVYKRTRKVNGKSVQRAEVRFDGVSGCLRTPVGGSSRQIILVANGASVRSRLLSPREAARLMGLGDDYVLPDKYNDAYHIMGDAVVVPVVRWIGEHILRPICHVNFSETGRTKIKRAS